MFSRVAIPIGSAKLSGLFTLCILKQMGMLIRMLFGSGRLTSIR